MREALRLVGIESDPHLEITSMADIPAGTGLGSSGSFTTALLRALHCLKKNSVPPRELAEQACHIEIDLLGEPIGKQDQYIAAFGGITCFTFHPDGRVDVEPLRISAGNPPQPGRQPDPVLHRLHPQRLRTSCKDQDSRSKQKDSGMLDNLHFVKQLAFESKAALETRRPALASPQLMHEHWEHKKRRTAGHEQPRNRRAATTWPRQRRPRRQTDRRRRRRLPHVLHRRQNACATP